LPYPAAFEPSLRSVAETRAARMGQEFPPLDMAGKDTLLRAHHPDYIEAAMTALRVGPNKGDRTLKELAVLLEAAPALDPAGVDPARPDRAVDVLVVGGGGAGTAAALVAKAAGATTLLVTKLRLGDANTMMAQGGIQAADKENDTPAQHYLDVMGGGGFHNDPDLVERLVRDAPGVISWLEELGCLFDKDPDGTMLTEHGGGTSRKRMHAARDYSGAEIMRTLRDEVCCQGVEVLEFSPAVELLTSPAGAVTGAVLRNLGTQKLEVVAAKTVILATGGSGRLHYQGFPTSNHYGAMADGLVLAYRAGAALNFVDTMQYHPTGVGFPEQIVGQLVTEKVRGLGAQLVNAAGEQFIYPLETRDVVASAIIRECSERFKGVATPAGGMGVWLDSPMIESIQGKGSVQRQLPAMVRQLERFDIDIAKEPMLVYPTMHYQNGGVSIGQDGATGLPGLYVAGEASGGVHGRNRLMGNSLLDVLVYGRAAGAAAAKAAQSAPSHPETGLAHLKKWNQEIAAAGIDPATRAPILLPDYRRQA
jgi:succinate dehydrogenase / fumarate reductase flavoprotein subunit